MSDVDLETVARAFGKLIPGDGELIVTRQGDGSVLARREQPGMTVDGDMLRDIIASAVPRMFTNEAAHRIADDALNGAVRAGMTVLHGPDLTPRAVSE